MMNRRVWQAVAVVLLSLGAASCSSGSGSAEGEDSGSPQSDTGTSKPDTGGKTHCGAGGTLCGIGETCTTGADCTSTACQDDKCVSQSCTDGVKDGSESDTDCGGSCGGCTTGKTCKGASDCVSDVCKDGVCVAPTDTDGVKNDSETDTDCGGGTLASGKPNPASDGASACGTGKTCLLGSDCVSDVCKAGVCAAPTDTDGVKNDSETDTDCGGGFLAGGAANPASDGAPTCGANKKCALATDCQSGVCTGGVCQSPTASDGVKNDSETDTDCGGGTLANGMPNPASDGASACDDTRACILGTDCVDLVCSNAPVTGTLGGSGAPINCPAGATCTCLAPTSTDGVKNDSETDIDCGGKYIDDMGTANTSSDGAPVCQVGQGCEVGSDCFTGVCNDNDGAGGLPDDCPEGSTCTCQAASSNDGVQNGGETDVDCGGSNAIGSDDAPACIPGKHCGSGVDCTSLVCGGGTCATPTPGDGVQNGGETDVDCGGATTPTCTSTPFVDCAPPCKDLKMCLAGTDCLSSYCGIDSGVSTTSKVCVDGLSCTGVGTTPASILDISVESDTFVGGHDAQGVPNANGAGESAGIDSCGAGESTDAVKTHESCCKSMTIPGSTARMDKYEVTTGRVRQFLESVKTTYGTYNVQAWVKAQFTPALAPSTAAGTALAQMIPTSQPGAINVIGLYPTSDTNTNGTYLNVVAQLGATTLDEGVPSAAQGCYMDVGAYGASTYWWPSAELDNAVGSPPRPFTQDYYDIKPQNCTPYWIAAAFCAWDGGSLPTQTQSNAVYGGSAYPWGGASPPVLWNGQAPGVLATQANAAGYTITNYTVDWHNSDLGSASGLGDFYYYPSYPGSNPSTGPLGSDAIVDSLTAGLDLTPYIAAPGRFTPDLTTARTTDTGHDGWMDYGANMMEYWQATSLTGNLGGGFGGSGNYCDTADSVNFSTGGNTSGNCPANTPTTTYCVRAKLGTSPQEYDCGIQRATPMPGIYWVGGSWEGHGIQSGGYNEPMQTQYGKAGFRCVRPAEP